MNSKRKAVVLIVSIVMFFQMFASNVVISQNPGTDLESKSNETQFGDISGHWAQEHIKKLEQRRLIAGYKTPEGYLIMPEKNITRAEYLTVLLKTRPSIKAIPDKVKDFTDVKNSDWFKETIDIASSNGIVEGYLDGTFKPNAPITRAEIAAIMARFNNWDKSHIDDSLPSFLDVDLNKWYYLPVMICRSKEIINGYPDGTFKPNNLASRAEAFALLANYISIVELSQDLVEEDEEDKPGKPEGEKNKDSQNGSSNTKTPSEQKENNPPEIDEIEVSRYSIFEGGTIYLLARTYDADGDPIFYKWEATDGEFDETDVQHVGWTAPDSLGDYDITLTISDGRGGTATKKITLSVVEMFSGGIPNPLFESGPDGDYDGDGLTNEEEIELDTNPFMADTDYDGLTDYEEVHIYGTDPSKADTSGDGILDAVKVKLGLDPLSTHTDGIEDSTRIFDVRKDFHTNIQMSDDYSNEVYHVEKDYLISEKTASKGGSDKEVLLATTEMVEKTTMSVNKEVRGSLSVRGGANIAQDIKVEVVENPLFMARKEVVGIPIKVKTRYFSRLDAEEMAITLTYDESELESKGIKPQQLSMYLFDEETQKYIEIENCQVNEDENTVTGYSTKLGIYTIAAKDIEGKDIGYLNIVFAIDMSENTLAFDWRGNYSWKGEFNRFLSNINDRSKVALMEFAADSFVIQDMTTNKLAVSNLINDMEYLSVPYKGDLKTGLQSGLDILENSDKNSSKALIIYTSTYDPSDKEKIVELLKKASQKGIVIYLINNTQDKNIYELIVNESGFVGKIFDIDFPKVDVRRINNDLDEFGNLSEITLQSAESKTKFNFRNFDIKLDSWRFKNFNSKCAPDGACYGFVTTALGLYYGVLPMRINKGHEDFESDSPGYNMKDHMEGLRIGDSGFNNGIYNYIKNLNVDNPNRTEKQKETQKMIETWFHSKRNHFSTKDLYKNSVPEEVIKEVKDYVKSGNIINVVLFRTEQGFLFREKVDGAHVATIYDVEEYDGMLNFKVYESNFPYGHLEYKDHWDTYLLLDKTSEENSYSWMYRYKSWNYLGFIDTEEYINYMWENLNYRSNYLESVRYDRNNNNYITHVHLKPLKDIKFDMSIENIRIEPQSPRTIPHSIITFNNGEVVIDRTHHHWNDVYFNVEFNDGTTDWVRVYSDEMLNGNNDTFYFTDVNDTDWYYKAIKALVLNNIVKGRKSVKRDNRDEITFVPQGNVTRAEALVTAMKICGYDKIINYNPYDRKPVFDDVFVNDWCYIYVRYAKENGMISATNIYTNEFLPNQEITRQEFAFIVDRVMDNRLKPHDSYDLLKSFSDESSIKYRSSVAKLVYNDAMNGFREGDKLFFKPKSKLTRGEMAQVFYNIVYRDQVGYQ